MASAVGVVLLCFAVYYPALFQETVNYDDPKWINAATPPSFQTLKEIITNSPPGRCSDLGYAAPMTASSIMVDLWIGQALGNTSMAHKGVNVLLHVVNSLLVLLFLGRLRFAPWVCLMVSAIFAVHPLQVSSVAWLAERKNLLMTLFFLLSTLCYLSYRNEAKLRFYVLAVLAFVLSLCSKPSAVTLGPCLLLTDMCILDKRITWRAFVNVAPFVALAVLWTIVATRSEGAVPDMPPLLDVILLFPYKMAFLVGKFVFPIDLSLVYPSLQVHSSQVMWWAPLALFAVAGILLWRIHRSVAIWGWIWGIGFYGLNMIPTSGLVPWKGMNELYVADHYQYIAMVGLATLAALGLARMTEAFWPKNPVYAKALVSCGAILPLAFASGFYLKAWQNSESLWLTVIKQNPGNYTARYNYGNYLQSRNRIDEAMTQYERAILIGGDRVHRAYFNLGGLFTENGRPDDAMHAFQTAIHFNPQFWPAHAALANLYFREGAYEKALDHCVKAQALGGACRPEAIKKAMEATQTR